MYQIFDFNKSKKKIIFFQYFQLGMDNKIRANSFSKLPPISPAIDSDRFNPIQ